MDNTFQKNLHLFASHIAHQRVNLENQILSLRSQLAEKYSLLTRDIIILKIKKQNDNHFQSILQQQQINFKQKQLNYLQQIKQLTISLQSSNSTQSNKKHYNLINQIKNQYQQKIYKLQDQKAKADSYRFELQQQIMKLRRKVNFQENGQNPSNMNISKKNNLNKTIIIPKVVQERNGSLQFEKHKFGVLGIKNEKDRFC